MMRHFGFLLSAVTATAVSKESVPQLNPQGQPLPPTIAKMLAAVGAPSNKWVTEQQLSKYFPTVDRASIQGGPVSIKLSSGPMNFFNMSQLPEAAASAVVQLPMEAGARSAKSGKLFPLPLRDILTKVAQERGYKNVYWAYEQHLPAFATKVKAGEVGISLPTGPAAAQKFQQGQPLSAVFNAEQTEHPERFVAENCVDPTLKKIDGTPLGWNSKAAVRGHILVNKLPADTVWSTASRLASCGIQLLPDSLPCTFVGENGDIVELYGESMTSHPQKVRDLASKRADTVVSGTIPIQKRE